MPRLSLATAKVFTNDNCQAIRLPMAFRVDVDEMWIAVVDVVGVLTDSADPRQYIEKMRSRDPALGANWGTTCAPLALQAPDGKQRETNCANTEGLFRIIQSIPSPERVKEIENPELASARACELYQAKGYPQTRRPCA